MIELTSFYNDQTEEPEKKVMFARGLFMLMYNERLNEGDWTHVSFELVKGIN